MVELHFCLPEV